MKNLLISCLLLLATSVAAQEQEVAIDRDFGKLRGTLLTPPTATQTAALIIAGSGPTDRNGNNRTQLTTNCYQQLAQALEKEGIASLRYDKRGIGGSYFADPEQGKEELRRFDQYVADAVACVDYLAAAGYRKIVLIGHSEGSHIALLAALQSPKVTAIVSASGAGYPFGDILKLQLANQLANVDPALMIEANGIIDRLSRGERVENPPQSLAALFRASGQPFLISCLALDPRKDIAKLSMPILIIQGDNDLQVTTDNAEALHKAQPKAELKLIKGMTHVLKRSDFHDLQGQYLSVYSDPKLPIDTDFTQAVAEFIKRL